jgi:hypothetical protein
LSIATNMPTKQNSNYYTLVASTDVDFNKRILELSIDPNNKDTIGRNTQVAAHLLLIYLHQRDVTNFGFADNDEMNRIAGIGISSGAVALAANHLGYRTGFCQCLIQEQVEKEIINRGVNLPEGTSGIQFMLGIGIPMADLKWNETIDSQRTIAPYTKTIKVIKL